MTNKKRIILIVTLLVILFSIFFIQKRLIDDFSLKPERIELSFDVNSEMIIYILSEEEYISERYKIGYEYGRNNLENDISIIFIKKPIGSEEEFFKEKFIDYLKLKIPNLNEEKLNIVDYSQTNRVLTEWNRAITLFITSLLFILIAIIFFKRIKIINKSLKKDLELYYLKEIINLRMTEILEETIKLVLLIFGGIFLLQWIIKFQFNILGKYLPTNDIFDFNFYQMRNKSIEMNLSSYGHIYDMTLNKVMLLTLGFFTIGIVTFLLIVKIINNKELEGSGTYGKSSI